MKVERAARNFHPDQVRSRYVRLAFDDKFRWCEVGADRSVDLRQGTVKETELPADVAAAARDRRAGGVSPFYVDWPL